MSVLNAARAAGQSVATPEPLGWAVAGLDDALGQAVAALRGAAHVVVVSHERPDGDAMGCTLACAEVVRALGATRVTAFNVSEVPSNLQFLPGASEVVAALPPEHPVDVTVMLDCGERHRVGAAFPPNGWGTTVICLDHHRTYDENAADVFVRDPSAPACAEMVYRLIVAAGVALTPTMATNLFCALQTDTGSFRYGSTTAHAMELGQRLLETGIEVWPISSAVYESNPIERLRLTARVLESLAVSDDGRFASLVVRQEDFDETGADDAMADGLINYARSIAGVEVAAQLTEAGDGFRVSMRSRGAVDVSKIAERFGGGGHRNAAGCNVAGALASVRAELSRALIDAMNGPTT